MPELPEVEALVRHLDARCRGHTIQSAQVGALSALKTHSPPLTAVIGCRVERWFRRGKFLVMASSGPMVCIHLSRGGWVRWREHVSTAPVGPRGPLAARWLLDTGAGFELTEQGTQKRLAVYVVDAVDDVPAIARLGIDARSPDLTVERLASLLHEDRRHLKAALADQTVIAGIGNAYSDEVLHHARLSPYRSAHSLANEETARLHGAIEDVVGRAAERAAACPMEELRPDKREAMAVHGRRGAACPVCADTVREVRLADRSFNYCPTCQTEGRILPDRRMARLLR